MKIIRYFLCLSLIVTSFACSIKSNKQGNFKLLPQPNKFEILGVSNIEFDDLKFYHSTTDTKIPVLGNLLKDISQNENPEDAQIIFSVDQFLDTKSEGYLLNITENQILISGKDKAGLFYAFKTLEQLLEDAKEQDVNLPMCNINDFPLLSYRAIHLDVKHHLEKLDYYYNLLDRLASYKVNAIIVEMEDKIKYNRQPIVASSDAISIEDWMKLSDYANERNIEISPLIQGLGHASFVLKHDKYKSLRDDPKSDWAFNPLDPKTYEVQFDLYLDAIEATPHGKYLHIGGDEVHTTGRGSKKSPLELQLLWLDKVCTFAEEHGRTPIFWDDMPLKHAGVYGAMFNAELTQKEVDEVWNENEHKLLKFLDQFPKNCIYMRWNYSSPQAIGNGKAMEWFRNNGLQVMGATAGQTRWVLMPQEESNMDNIKSFAISSIENGLNGLLLTLWDDDSPHFELYLRGIISFAEYTWAGEKRSKEKIKSAYRQREFSNTVSDSEYAFIDELEKPVAFWKNALLKGNQRNRLMKMNNPIDEAVIDLPVNDKRGYWSEQNKERLAESLIAIKKCDSISTKITTMKSNATRNIYTLEVYEQVNKLSQFAPTILLALKEYDSANNEQYKKDAINKIQQLSDEFKVLRNEFELVYGRTRILTKPDNYILDQDHHSHLANQTKSFAWQFYAEILFLEKIGNEILK